MQAPVFQLLKYIAFNSSFLWNFTWMGKNDVSVSMWSNNSLLSGLPLHPKCLWDRWLGCAFKLTASKSFVLDIQTPLKWQNVPDKFSLCARVLQRLLISEQFNLWNTLAYECLAFFWETHFYNAVCCTKKFSCTGKIFKKKQELIAWLEI